MSEVLLLHAADERGDAELLAHERARRGAADRVHLPAQRECRLLQAGGELLVVVLGIGLRTRIPRELLREHDLAALERGDLEVARAEVEPDAVAVHVVLHEDFALVRDGHLPERHDLDFHGTPVEGAEEVVVERAQALLRVRLRDRLHDFVRPREVELPPARAPEHELRDALHEVPHARQHHRVDALRDLQIVAADVTALALPRHGHDLPVPVRVRAQEVQRLERSLKARVCLLMGAAAHTT